MHSPSSPFECPVKIHVKLNAHCQIKRTSFPGAGAFNLTNVHLLFQVTTDFVLLLDRDSSGSISTKFDKTKFTVIMYGIPGIQKMRFEK